MDAKPKKSLLIPVIIVGLLVVGALGLSYFLSRTQTGSDVKAKKPPTNISISSVSSNSFTVEWETVENELGAVNYGTTPSDLADVAVGASATTKSRTHSVIASPLKPSTTYYFELISGGERYNNSGTPYTVTTR